MPSGKFAPHQRLEHRHPDQGVVEDGKMGREVNARRRLELFTAADRDLFGVPRAIGKPARKSPRGVPRGRGVRAARRSRGSSHGASETRLEKPISTGRPIASDSNRALFTHCGQVIEMRRPFEHAVKAGDRRIRARNRIADPRPQTDAASAAIS